MKKNTKIALSLLGATAAFAGASYLVYYSVMDRYTEIPSKISAIAEKKMAKPAMGNPSDADDPLEKNNEWFNMQRLVEYTMENNRGQFLKGYLLPAENESNVYVFCSHGYRNHGRGEFNYMAKFYHDMGYNVFLVDHQAAGESDGRIIGFGYYEYRDCLKWLSFMRDCFGTDIQIILHGVSMGSATVMMMSGTYELPSNVKFTVADCGYTTAWDEFYYNLKNFKVPAFPILNGADVMCRIFGGYGFKQADALSAVKNAKIPMLFIHGGDDWFVPTYMGTTLFAACGAPYKDLLIVPGAEHARSYRVDNVSYEAKVKEFADKFIEAPKEKKIEKKPAVKKPQAKKKAPAKK